MTPERFRVVVIVLLVAILGVAIATCNYAYEARSSAHNCSIESSYTLSTDTFNESMDELNHRLDGLESDIDNVKSRLPN